MEISEIEQDKRKRKFFRAATIPCYTSRKKRKNTCMILNKNEVRHPIA